MATTALNTLIQESARKAGLFHGPTAPSAGSSATSFTMGGTSSAFDEVDEDTILEDVWVKCESDSAVTPLNVGEVRRVKSYESTTFVVTLATSRGFSNTPTTTQQMGFYWAIPPGTSWRNLKGWTYYINQVLQNIRHHRYGLLTLVTDGDMETSGTSNWTATTATLTKTTTAANVSFGSQSMRVANSSANGLSRSAAINVAPGDTYYVRADVQVASGTAVLEAYDHTQSASIATESSTYYDWRTVYFNFTIPSGCNQITIRLKGTEATADAYWDNVALYSSGVRRFTLPSWVTKPGDVEALYEYRGFYSQGDEVSLDSHRLFPLPYRHTIWDDLAATQGRIELHCIPHSGSLLLIRGLSRYSTLTGDSTGSTADDSATTTADQNLVIAGACYLAMRDLRGKDHPDTKRFLTEYRERANTLPRRSRYII